MAFVLVQIRPVGTGRFPWRILSSDTPYHQDESTEESALTYVRNIARCSDNSLMVVLHNLQDRPNQAWAVKGESWRDLGLIAKHPDGQSHGLYEGLIERSLATA